MRVLSKAELSEQARLLAEDAFCADPADIAAAALDRLLPRDDISTLEYSLKHRVIRKPDGTKTDWSLSLTPYLAPIMAAHDDPEVFEIVVPKPGRSGGTVVAENHALKRLDFGPNGDVMWYLAGPNEVASYADRVLAPLFEDHPGVSSRIGEGRSDDNKTRKRVAGQTFELLVMSGKTTTNRQGAYIVFDEPDSYHKDFRSNFLDQGRQRQRMLGNDRKIYACAHPDLGWGGGIAAAWLLSTQGVFIFRCPECGGHGSPYPTKHWPGVERFRLSYTKAPEGTPINARLALAEETACIACPHCGSALGEAERRAMVDEAAGWPGGGYMHKGQSLDIKAGIVGEPHGSRTWGFWIHVLMCPQVGLGELARDLEGAIEHKERTGKTDKLKQVLVRTFGEAFEGAADVTGLDAQALKRRTTELAEADKGFRLGEVPPDVLFITLAIDVGGGKFDLLARGWDRQRRSWIIDRRTIRQRVHEDGIARDIAPPKVQDDWDVLAAEVQRLYPLRDDPSKALPIACVVIDSGDGNVTWKAYEFARRMHRIRWGAWQRVRCIKGAKSATAEPLPATPLKISKDSEGRPVEPVVTLHTLGVHRLKEEVLDDIAIEDGLPGAVHFARNMPDKAYEELFNEVLVDGSWHRTGPNETLDLMGYAEAARLMLQPDRKNIRWDDPDARPAWARPVSLLAEGGDQVSPGAVGPDQSKAAPAPKRASLFDKHRNLEGVESDADRG